MALPNFVVLKSNNNNKYLSYINKDEEKIDGDPGLPEGLLSFSTEDVWSPCAKFQVKKAMGSTNKGLVNIRCCHNNKYLARVGDHKNSSSDNPQPRIVAVEAKRVEDQSRESCTLFKPVYQDENIVDGVIAILRFVHIHIINSLLSSNNETTVETYQGFGSPNMELLDECTVIDWKSLVKVPKYVAFQSSANGKLLSPQWVRNPYSNGQTLPYMTTFFSDEWDNPRSVNVVFTKADGSVRIKSNSMGKFWSVSDGEWNWIMADSDDPTTTETSFWPVKVGDNLIALRSMHVKKFLGRLTHYGYELTAGLSAYNPSDQVERHLWVHEHVSCSCEVFNVLFHIRDARIYNQQVIEMAKREAVNSGEESETVELMLTYTSTWRRSWNSSLSSEFKLNMKSGLRVGFPVIVDGGKMELDFSGTEMKPEGGSETVTSSVKTIVCRVVVPAKTRVKVRLVATEAWCDVPFSYKERNITTKGKMIISDLDDGVYTGVNAFDFDFKFENTQVHQGLLI